MSTYDDDLFAGRFAALAPEPLAANWDDVLDRAGARKDRRRLGSSRAAQGRRRRLLVVLAAVALVAVAAASAFAVRAFVLGSGFSGLPPAGATPSTPESGVLEMYYWVRTSVGGTRSRTWVYADGRLIGLGVRRDNGTPLPGFREQRLTREGVDRLRSEIISAGGFGRAQRPPGSTPLDSVNPPTIQVRRGGRLVPLGWASDLKRLGARLASPESWLPASAWKQREIKAAYVPSRFEVCAFVSDGLHIQPMRPTRIVALLPAAAQSLLRGRDWKATRGQVCFAVRTEGARSLAKALDHAGPAKKGRLNFRFDAPDPSRQVWITFNPYLPHGETTCLQCG